MKRTVQVSLFVLASLAAGAAFAQPKPYDVSVVREFLKVFHDGKGHYVILVPFASCDQGEHRDQKAAAVFYGDGKSFWAMRIVGSGASCGDRKFDLTFWDPRITALWKSSLDYQDAKLSARCEDRVTELKEASEPEQKKVSVAAKFFQPRWQRMPHQLARDDEGTYYFVDVARDTGKDHRLWKGQKGAMKPLKMKNIVADSEGEIYSTTTGELRMVFDKKEFAWIKGKERLTLTNVPVPDNARMIYTELGVYDQERLGTPCDDL